MKEARFFVIVIIVSSFCCAFAEENPLTNKYFAELESTITKINENGYAPDATFPQLKRLLSACPVIDIDDLHLQCVPCYLITSYETFKNECPLDNFPYVVWERFEHVHPYDFIIGYNNGFWDSIDRFAAAGQAAFESGKFVSVKVLKHTLDTIKMSRFHMQHAVNFFDTEGIMQLQYGISGMDGLLVVGKTKAIPETECIETGSFIYVLEQAGNCEKCSKRLKASPVNMAKYITDRLRNKLPLTLKVYRPFSYEALNKHMFFHKKKMDYMLNYYIKHGKAKSTKEYLNWQIFKNDEHIEFVKYLCENMKWAWIVPLTIKEVDISMNE